MYLKSLPSLFATSGAKFSEDKKYRYTLWRQWNSAGERVAFVMLNPSTADAWTNDPTVERCHRRAIQWGFGSLVVVNIFALRSTDPAKLYTDSDPVGPENDKHLHHAAKYSHLIVCGWGSHGKLLKRGDTALAILRAASAKLPFCLKQNADGQPAHPLYLPYSLKPFPILSPNVTYTLDHRPTLDMVADCAAANYADDLL